MEAIVAIDIGTTGAKTALVDRTGALVASALATYPTHTAAGNVVEQAPQDWWVAACRALRDLWAAAPTGVTVGAVILSGQMRIRSCWAQTMWSGRPCYIPTAGRRRKRL